MVVGLEYLSKTVGGTNGNKRWLVISPKLVYLSVMLLLTLEIGQQSNLVYPVTEMQET